MTMTMECGLLGVEYEQFNGSQMTCDRLLGVLRPCCMAPLVAAHSNGYAWEKTSPQCRHKITPN